MSLHSQHPDPVPEDNARVARTAKLPAQWRVAASITALPALCPPRRPAALATGNMVASRSIGARPARLPSRVSDSGCT
jgi:hypothetical protein